MQPMVRMESEDAVIVAERCRQNRDCRQNNASFALLEVMLTSVDNGAPGRIRTADPLFRSSKIRSLQERVTEVERALSVWKRQWLLGFVAVSVAVRDQQSVGRLAVSTMVVSNALSPPFELDRSWL